MAQTKTISLRVSEEFYDRIILEAAKDNISITEWLHRRISLMNILQKEKVQFLNYLGSIEEKLEMGGDILGLPMVERVKGFVNIIP